MLTSSYHSLFWLLELDLMTRHFQKQSFSEKYLDFCIYLDMYVYIDLLALSRRYKSADSTTFFYVIIKIMEFQHLRLRCTYFLKFSPEASLEISRARLSAARRDRSGAEDRRRGGGGQEESGGGCCSRDTQSLLPTRGTTETPSLHVNFRHSIQVKLLLISAG